MHQPHSGSWDSLAMLSGLKWSLNSTSARWKEFYCHAGCRPGWSGKISITKKLPYYHSTIIARHVVWQHHERQDGSGYPRKLRGLNKFGYDAKQYYGKGVMLPCAEIAAVADVYSAMASDRPYRPALPMAEIFSTLRSIAGTQLNREIVDRFLSVVPRYPVGTEVVLIGGELNGCRGVVAEVHSLNIHRPTVRVLFDPAGSGVEPYEVDTGKEKLSLRAWVNGARAVTG